MNDYLSVVMGSLSNLNVDELNKVIEAAQRKKDKIETDKKHTAATDLVEAFIAYKEAIGNMRLSSILVNIFCLVENLQDNFTKNFGLSQI